MITPEQAQERIAKCFIHTGEEAVALNDALHRVLAENLHADTDLPPFHRVMMDGIALRYAAIERGIRSFRIQAMQRAGETALSLINDDECIEVMTGAVCAERCDTVVPYEHFRLQDNVAHLEIVPSAKGKNIHWQGSDKRSGDLLVTSGSMLTPAEIGIAASIGKLQLVVKRLPRILVCSTGDELIEVHETPLPHQIRRSNVYALLAMIKQLGIRAENRHLPDEKSALQRTLRDALETFDVLILSGGVSKGKFDLLPEVLAGLGVEPVFHNLQQRPGKPMWFGQTATAAVFALPGNPVSTLACAFRYVMPWLKNQLGFMGNQQWVRLHESIQRNEKLTLLLPACLEHAQNGRTAHIIRNQGSGDFSALTGMEGFVEIPAGLTEAECGTSVRYFPANE